MLTGNRALLGRYDSLKKQLSETKKEMRLRAKKQSIDNDGEVLYRIGEDSYMVIEEEHMELIMESKSPHDGVGHDSDSESPR